MVRARRCLETEATKGSSRHRHRRSTTGRTWRGGRGGSADNKQRAHMWALTYGFLAKALGLRAERGGYYAPLHTTFILLR
jgi:hypothetical protein